MKHIVVETFEQGFISINQLVLEAPESITQSRLGICNEVQNVMLEVINPGIAVFENPNANRISYKYAKAFWDFMISGGTDAKEAFKEYPNVAKFIEKPKSKELPENFNTFYGPRIAAQLPIVLEELNRDPNTRRAVIHILTERDQVLLDKNESLEYPCTNSITFSIRNDKLNMHVHMRSQNTAVVLQLDMYLMSKLFDKVAKELNVEKGTYCTSIVSAHIYEKDFDYIKGVLDAE